MIKVIIVVTSSKTEDNKNNEYQEESNNYNKENKNNNTTKKILYQRISQKYTVAKKDKKELPALKNLCAKLFGKKRFILANVNNYKNLLNFHNEARKTKTVIN